MKINHSVVTFPFCHFREHAEYDVIELVHTLPVPVSIFRYSYCPYKYCVFSKPAEEFMESPFEFIAEHDRSHTTKIINRSLRLSDSVHITREGE